WRGVEVRDELRAALTLLGDRTVVGMPRVLADRDPDAHARDLEQPVRTAAGLEVPLLVEDGVVGEVALAIDADALAASRHDRRVVEASFHEAEHRDAV